MEEKRNDEQPKDRAPGQESEQEVFGKTKQVGEPLGSAPYQSPIVSEMLGDMPSYMARSVIYVLVFTILVGVVWAYFGKMDVVVAGRGRLVPVGELKIVQAKTNGYVSKILVKVGDIVKKDQVLAQLDLTAQNVRQEGKANELEKQKRDFECFKYAVSIYEKVLAGAEAGETREEILKLCSSDYAGEIMKIYQENLGYEKAKLQKDVLYPSSLATLKDGIALKERALENKKRVLAAAQAEFGRVKREFEIYKSMVVKGLASEVKLLEKQKSYDEARGKIAEAELDLRSGQGELLDAKVKYNNTKLQYAASWKEAEFSHNQAIQAARQKLAEFKIKLGDIKKAIGMMERDQALTRIEGQYLSIQAPVDGVVSDVFVKNVNQVVRTGLTLFTILPSGQPLVGEILLANRNIGQVRPGLEVKIKFDAYAYQSYGLGKGKIISVSPTPEEIGGNSFYKVVTQMDKDFLVKGKKNYRLFAGLTFLGEVVVERQRIIDVFLRPLRGAQEG